MSKQPVHEAVNFEFSNPVSVEAVRVNVDGTIDLLAGGVSLLPQHVSVGQHRLRENGREKSIFEIPLNGAPRRLREAELLMPFSRVFTIDTNTVRIADEPVSFAMIAMSKLIAQGETGERHLLMTCHPGGYEFRGMRDSQERLAWTLLQDAIVGSPDFEPGAKYLIISDHAKSLHSAINRHEEPLFGEVLLNPALTLAYATSDSGTSISRQLIKSCDRLASKYLRDLKDSTIGDQNLRHIVGGPITAFRGVENTSVILPGGLGSFRLSKRTTLIDKLAGG